jgi:hypothetical protein
VLLHVLLVQQVDGKLSWRPASFRTCKDALLQDQRQQQHHHHQQQQQELCFLC